MTKVHDAVVVLPTYNERSNIEQIIPAILAAIGEVSSRSRAQSAPAQTVPRRRRSATRRAAA